MTLLVFLCFFFSGASGLLFEVLWTRELGLVFGSTTLAISTVLSVYMGGLALGSLIGGRLCDRRGAAELPWLSRRPLLTYAAVEAGVGLFALAVPALLAYYPQLNALLWRSVGDRYALLSLLRFLATAALLLFPTTLMGATLPLLAEYMTRPGQGGRAGDAHGPRRDSMAEPADPSDGHEPRSAAQHIGALFAANTAGAVFGTFLSGFVLLPRLGVTQTNYLGAAINLSLALAIALGHLRAAVLRRRNKPVQLDSEPEPAPADSAEQAALTPHEPVADEAPAVSASAVHRDIVLPSAAARRLSVLCYAVSGATAMVYQVLWTRALAIVIGSSVYSFTLILLAFLIGLSAGAALATRLLPLVRRPVRALAITHAATLGTALWSFYILPRLPAVFVSILRGSSFTVDELLTTQFVLAALAIAPATVAMGGVMPLTMHVYTLRKNRQASGDASAQPARAAAAPANESIGHDVGIAYAWNTLGAITGSFAAGFFVLPELGLQRGLIVCSLLTAGLAALLLLADRGRISRLIAPAIIVAALLSAWLLPRWNLTHFSAGLFRISLARQVIFYEDRRQPEMLFYKDGVATTVSVEKWGKHLALKNNGKVDASNGDDMSTQIMVGLLPLLFHPTALDKPPNVAVVGYGSGVTIGAVTQFPIAHADVVELEPAVVEAGDRYFADVSHLPSRDPRVRVIIGDGRNFMTQSDQPYDVIISEPSNPWISGVSNLFTTDYWKLARSRLSDEGVFCQWAQLYELSQPNVKTLLRSFASVFPYTYVFAAEHRSSDVLLIASKRPLPLDVERLRRNFSERFPQLRAELHRAGVDQPEEVLADLLLVPDELSAYTAGALLNTDDNALIEFRAPRDLLGYLRNDLTVARPYGNDWPYGRFERYLENHGAVTGPAGSPRAEFYGRLGRALLSHGKREAAKRVLARARGLGGGAATDHLSSLLALLEKHGQNSFEEPLHRDWDGEDSHIADGLGPLHLPPATLLKPGDEARIRRDYESALRALRERRFAAGLRALRDWPMAWVAEMGPDLRFLIGYLLYKLDLHNDARDHLEVLVDDDEPEPSDWLKQHPSALYYLGRSEFFDADPQTGILHLERYLRMRAQPPTSSNEAPRNRAG
ncbi:MAG: fused MFS/spermidine synthase [Myxococcales bacterium]|nr:fused MFS/spermidine synthase [Myxococcales bacterium]